MPPSSQDLLALGEAIREARKEQDLSQEALALAADVDRAFMSALERGQRNVTLANLLKVCRALDEEPSALFKRWERIAGWKTQAQ
ncbi:MAG: helix-turn-helix domain-containing protein [Solirubrobacterales bacterium]